MFQSVVTRAALGRPGTIGSLYDARTESFVFDTLFESKIGDASIRKEDLDDASFELVMSDNIPDKFKKLGIETELQASVLAGLVKLSGSGAYLDDVKISARSVSMTMIYKIRTICENLLLGEIGCEINTALLRSIKDWGNPATHVVVGIEWGAFCCITCEYKNSENEDEAVLKKALQAQLEKLKCLVSAKESTVADYAGDDDNNITKFTFKCKSDVFSSHHNLPSTFEDAFRLAKSMQSQVTSTDGGKGVPLCYMLLPLDVFAKICKPPISLEINLRAIDDDTVKTTTEVVENLTEKRQRLRDIQVDLHCQSNYVSDETLRTIDKYVDEMFAETTAFRSELQKLTKEIRHQKADLSQLKGLLCKYSTENSPGSLHEAQLREFDEDFNRLKDMDAWKARGIVYLGKNDRFVANDMFTMYVFYRPREDNEIASQTQNFFLRYQKTYGKGEAVFKVIDEAVTADLWAEEGRPVIVVYTDGVKTCSDFYDEEVRRNEMCVIKHSKTQPYQQKPAEIAYVKIRCPNGQCSGNPVMWTCLKCKNIVEYGLKTLNFYCKCGEYVLAASTFRCNESAHGTDYVNYPHDLLLQELSSLPAIKETNILVLGETGVGKSTWINAIYNYLSFADLNEATEAKEELVLIPSKFRFTKDDGTSVEVSIGEPSDNEIQQTGHSATQQAQSYVFPVGDKKISLIDTPGIGDIRGLDQDRKNFDHVLSFLSHYQEIHAVCILLKPNNSRLTAMFRFCIQELLARLHNSVKSNIVFCFTNARGTFYKPGDTLPALNKMLDSRGTGIKATPDNYYCFDNEPFRFLACIHNGIVFSDEEIKTYATSWNRAAKEINRMFEKINQMPPHKVRNTISMNEARRVIVAMSKPMAEVAKTIQENVQAANEVKQQIDVQNNDMSKLHKSLHFKGVDIVRNELPYPRTVCAHPNCIIRVRVGLGKTHSVGYKAVCHDHCTLRGISTELTNNWRLLFCECISGLSCTRCHHQYSYHMHQTYTLDKVEKVFVDEEVQKEILSKKSATEQKEAFKQSIECKVNELQNEETTIMKVCAKYGAFLKENAIIAYNDAVGDYLDIVIKQEENQAESFRNNGFLSRLRQLKSEYEKEKLALDAAIAEGLESTTTEHVMQLQQDLFELKHFGMTLKKIFDGISISSSANGMRFQEITAHLQRNFPRCGPDTGNKATIMEESNEDPWYVIAFNNAKFW